VRALASQASVESTTSRIRKAHGTSLLVGAAAFVTAVTILSPRGNQKTRLEAPAKAETEESVVKKSEDEETTLLNWSGTHTVNTKHYWEPETVEELEAVVLECHSKGQSVRPIGSALSPNGLSFHSEGMVSLVHLDKILEVDTKNMTVTTQSGARVSQVIDALNTHGLTLPNLASIAEQQMGGFTQVGAHGTGAKIAPVDHYVTKLRIITPSLGDMVLTEDQGVFFQLAKVGLGCMGVVAEVTMKCVPAHNLVERTFVLTRREAREQIQQLLVNHKHIRFMWIPYQDVVVVVANDPDADVAEHVPRNLMHFSEPERLEPFRNLYIELTKDNPEPVTLESLKGMGFGELRDALLGMDPLDVDHVKKVNEAEAEFWRRSQGYQTKPSHQLLQFDCGGQQWVKEVALPTGTLHENNGNDIMFMEKLLQGIEDQQIPAHSPIEQRWSAPSSSLMSPVHGTDPNGLHSWVGIIMYLPSADDELQRRAITESFTGQYCTLMDTLGQEVDAASHWAKLELPRDMWKLLDLQMAMSKRYPLHLFNKAREMVDPKDILGNPLLNLVFGSKLRNPENARKED